MIRRFRTVAVLTALPLGALYGLGDYKRNAALQYQNRTRVNPFEKDSKSAKKAIVIGSGVIGTSTAYRLAKKGYSVVVVDAASKPSDECSAVAAGGMQRANPLVDRSTWKVVVKSILSNRSSSFFHLDAFTTFSCPHFWRWITRFSIASLVEDGAGHGDGRKRQDAMLNFTNWAIDLTQETMNELGIAEQCGLSRAGALKLHYVGEDTSLSKSSNSLEPAQHISAEKVFELEPNLRGHNPAIESAKYEHEAAMGDSLRFTSKLAEESQRIGVTFKFNTKVTSLELQQNGDGDGDGKRISALVTDNEVIEVPDQAQVVVAAGSWTPRLLWYADLFVPVYPMKGYSVIIDLPPKGDPSRPPAEDLPNRIVSDSIMYTARLGERVRMASMGHFSGWDVSPDATVDKAFRAIAIEHQPALTNLIKNTPTRCGLRPFVSDGFILMGKLPTLQNAYVNVGPGEVVAREMERDVAGDGDRDGDGDGFDPALLSPADNRVSFAPWWSRLSIARWC